MGGLNGKRFAYTLDMSNVGCHCNAALTLLTCLETMAVKMVTITVMPTMEVESGVRSMMLWRVTSTPWPVHSIPAMEEVETGTTVMAVVARQMLLMLTVE